MRIADVLKAKGSRRRDDHPETPVAVLLTGLVDRNIGAMVVVGPDRAGRHRRPNAMWCTNCTISARTCWAGRSARS